MDVSTYDEHISGAYHETITIHTKLNSNNKGFALLAKMGWKEGMGLGVEGDGALQALLNK